MIAAFLAACGPGAEQHVTSSQTKSSETNSGVTKVRKGTDDPPIPVVVGNTLLVPGRAPITLQTEPTSGFQGWLAPVVVTTSAGSVVYSTWADKRPVNNRIPISEQGIKEGDLLARPQVRVLDTANGVDRPVAQGAYAAAVRKDGAMAWARGLSQDYLYQRRYATEVEMRSSPAAAAGSVWSSRSSRYVPVAWANDKLLAYEVGQQERLTLLLMDGPGNVRIFADDAALVALSPDATQALISRVGPQGSSLALLAVPSGETLSKIDVPELTSIGYGGEWIDNLAVVNASSFTGPALVTIRVDKTALSIDQIMAFDNVTVRAGLEEPRFVPGAAQRRVVSRSSIRGPDGFGLGYEFLDCDMKNRECTTSKTYSSLAVFTPGNPSRP